MNVRIRKLTPDATLPTYATAGAAGFDLYAAADVIIAPGETVKVPLGLAFEIPDGYEMQVRPRSGVTSRTGLRIANAPGTIDADFRGDVSIIVDNVSAVPPKYDGSNYCVRDLEGNCVPYMNAGKGTYLIRKGDRIAQGVVAPVTRVSFTETDEELTQTERGERGFGHSGI